MLDLKPVKRTPKVLTEKDIESAGKKRVKENDGESYKFTSPGRRAVPDQLELYGVGAMVKLLRDRMPRSFGDMSHYALARACEHLSVLSDEALGRICADLLAAAVQFTEYKAPGKKPTPAQAAEHARLRARGFTVNVVDKLP